MSRYTVAEAPTFGEPPAPITPTAGQPGRWSHIFDQLAKRPGEWAQVGTINARSSLGKDKHTFANHGVEVTTRTNGDGTSAIWARFVGVGKVPAGVKRTSHRATAVVMHHLDFRLPEGMPGPLVWAPPVEAAS